jgi:hypothetical protein
MTSQVRLYILGKLDTKDAKTQRLTTLAEFRDGRALERVELNARQKGNLDKSVEKLRSFLMIGDPPFNAQNLRMMGQKLFGLIIRGTVSGLLSAAAGPNRDIVPLELIVEDPTIAGWPWEYAYDESVGQFLCKAFHPISRAIFGPNPGALPPVRTGPIRILFVFGASRTDPEANVDAQEDRLRHVFKRINAMQGVEMKFLRAVGPQELDQELTENHYDILHFFGHAGLDAERDEGYLIFDSEHKKKKRYYAGNLGPLLAKRGLRLAFLNACETAVAAAEVDPGRSALAATLLGYGVPAVVATQFLMPDNSAHFLAESIYRALLEGATIVEAMRAGRRSMQFTDDERHPDWGIPVLYSYCPDLIIFPSNAGS